MVKKLYSPPTQKARAQADEILASCVKDQRGDRLDVVGKLTQLDRSNSAAYEIAAMMGAGVGEAKRTAALISASVLFLRAAVMEATEDAVNADRLPGSPTFAEAAYGVKPEANGHNGKSPSDDAEPIAAKDAETLRDMVQGLSHHLTTCGQQMHGIEFDTHTGIMIVQALREFVDRRRVFNSAKPKAAATV